MKVTHSEKKEKLYSRWGRTCFPECHEIANCCYVDDNDYESDDSIYDNPKKFIKDINEEKVDDAQPKTVNGNEMISFNTNPYYDVEMTHLVGIESRQNHVDHITTTENPYYEYK